MIHLEAIVYLLALNQTKELKNRTLKALQSRSKQVRQRIQLSKNSIGHLYLEINIMITLMDFP